MKLAVFLCLSSIAVATYGALILGPHSEVYRNLLTVAQFLEKIPDISEDLELPADFKAHLDEKIAEFKSSVEYYDEGECIITEGDDNDKNLYYLLSGKVEVYRSTKNNEEKKLVKVHENPFTFGELAYLGGSRSASVCTKSHVTVLKIPYRVVRAFMKESLLLSQKFDEYLRGKRAFFGSF